MEQYYGYFLYALSLLTMGGIYAVLTLGLNVQWGFTGLFNAGIAGFFAVGAYVQAILTTPIFERHLGGYNWPIPLAMLAAMVGSAVVAYGVAKICIRLRADYLAIATIGIAEIIRRVMTAIRENEAAAAAAGKNVERFRLESCVIGSAVMGLGGALMAQYLKQIDPQVSDPLTATFLVWVMLIAGGSANNRGAILGAMLMWTVWSATEILTSRLPDEFAIRSAYVRIFLIGLILQLILQIRPQGILPERRPKPHPSLRGDRAPAGHIGRTEQ